MLLSNAGDSGFIDQTAQFPFVAGNALSGAILDLSADQYETDVAVLYEDGRIVIYKDQSLATYKAILVSDKLSSAHTIFTTDLDNDGWTDLVVATSHGTKFLFNDRGQLKFAGDIPFSGARVFADFGNRGFADLLVDV